LRTGYLILVGLLAAVGAFRPTVARAEPFTGLIYDENSNKTKLLFTLKRTETKTGDVTKIGGVFTGTDGKEAVTEDVTVQGAKLQKYVLKKPQINESGFMEVRGNKIHFEWTKEGKTDTDDEDYKDNLIIGPTTIEYLKNHWAAILRGDDVDTRFAALDRKETVGFKFFKIEELKQGDRDLVKIKMKPTSFIIAAIVKPLIFTMEKSTARLVELEGRTLPKRLDDGKWKDLDADIVYQY
jgi:hypothetical protein